MTAPSSRRFIASLALPAIVLLVIPTALVLVTRSWHFGWSLPPAFAVAISTIGLDLIGLGLSLLISTIRHFADHGQGTLAPWDPTRQLVVRGIYRHVRNPMHIGVFAVLYGEGVLAGSIPLLLFATAVVLIHLLYIPLSEEPGLEARFGASYMDYSQHVPRWLPRLAPWEPEAGGGQGTPAGGTQARLQLADEGEPRGKSRDQD